MPPKGYGQRRTVERGIYEDARGYEVVARVGRNRISKRFPAGTKPEKLRKWRDSNVADLRDDEQRPTNDPDALSKSIQRYKQIVATIDSPSTAAFNAWNARHGDTPRRSLTPALAQQAFDAWRAEGKSPQTLFYRKQVIQKLWRALDGPKAKTPVDDIKITRPKARRPVWVPDEVIKAVAKTLEQHEQPQRLKDGTLGDPFLKDSKTRARFLVLASTGQRPSQMRLAKREDIDLENGIWWVRAAKGGDPIPIYMTADMRAAWALFIKADAFGPYDRWNFKRVLQRCGWPKDVRPYNLRHATALTLSEAGVDLRDISSHLGHRDLKTTMIYAPQLHSRLRSLGSKLEGRFGWTHPTRVVGKRGKGRK